MADISAWSPVDESNTSAPPNGWPENMQPSAVNNSARALMGGVRRWYDTVTTQLASIAANFNNYLLLTGGTLSGSLFGTTIQAGQLTSTGNIGAGGTIAATLDVTAGRNMSVGNTLYAGNLDVTGTATLSGVTAVAVSANTVSASAYDCDGVRVIDTSGATPLYYKAGGVWGIQLGAADSFYDNNNHWFRNFGGTNSFVINASGTVTATQDVVASRNVSAANNITATAAVQGNYVYSTNLMRADGSLTTGFDITAGRDVVATRNMTCGATFTSTAGFSNINAIQPASDHNGFVGKAGLSYDSMSCFNYITVSDADLKCDIEEPTGCLDMVRAVPARTYRWESGPDTENRHWGLVAQEAGEAGFSGRLIDPETGQQGLVLNELVALLWGAVRELSDKLDKAHSTRE